MATPGTPNGKAVGCCCWGTAAGPNKLVGYEGAGPAAGFGANMPPPKGDVELLLAAGAPPPKILAPAVPVDGAAAPKSPVFGEGWPKTADWLLTSP